MGHSDDRDVHDGQQRGRGGEHQDEVHDHERRRPDGLARRVLPHRWDVVAQAAVHPLVDGPQFGVDLRRPPARRGIPEEDATHRDDERGRRHPRTAKISARFPGVRHGGEERDERHGAIAECPGDETDPDGALLRIPLRDGGSASGVDDSGTGAAQHGVTEHREHEAVGVGESQWTGGAQEGADEHRARRSHCRAVAQRGGRRGRPAWNTTQRASTQRRARRARSVRSRAAR